MSQELLETSNLDDQRPWKRIGKVEADRLNQRRPIRSDKQLAGKYEGRFHLLGGIRRFGANVFLNMVDWASRATHRPIVDIGQNYSVSALNDRINQLEEILVRQWTHLKDSDYLEPNEEIQQYLAACHIARQYDRITLELLTSRLGVSQTQASSLIDQLMADEIITESYVVTYHDVRRAAIDVAIEQKLKVLHQNDVNADSYSTKSSPAKKH